MTVAHRPMLGCVPLVSVVDEMALLSWGGLKGGRGCSLVPLAWATSCGLLPSWAPLPDGGGNWQLVQCQCGHVHWLPIEDGD